MASALARLGNPEHWVGDDDLVFVRAAGGYLDGSALRSAAGRKPDDRALSDLVGELSTRSEEFRGEWVRHDVRFHNSGMKRLHHSQVGDVELRYEGLQVVSDTDLTIYVYTADPGTRSAEALALLGTLAATAAAEKPSPAP